MSGPRVLVLVVGITCLLNLLVVLGAYLLLWRKLERDHRAFDQKNRREAAAEFEQMVGDFAERVVNAGTTQPSDDLLAQLAGEVPADQGIELRETRRGDGLVLVIRAAVRRGGFAGWVSGLTFAYFRIELTGLGGPAAQYRVEQVPYDRRSPK